MDPKSISGILEKFTQLLDKEKEHQDTGYIDELEDYYLDKGDRNDQWTDFIQQVQEDPKSISEEFIRLLENEKANQSIGYLKKLADHYLEMAERSGQWPDFIKAHGLYNACGKREPGIRIWYEKAYEVECRYHSISKGYLSTINLQEHRDTMDSLLRSLKELRSHIKQHLATAEDKHKDVLYFSDKVEDVDDIRKSNFCSDIKSISRICSNHMVSFVADLMASAVRFTGPPRCRFAVVAIGSLAKGEATPYSDLEYFFLIESQEYVTEFEHLAVTSYFLINNLRESNLKIYDIKELKELEPSFKDHTRSGFEIDGLTEKAGNIPTGHGPGTRTNNKFITTVDELVSQYERTLSSPITGDNTIADLSAMLASTVFIFGNEALHQDFIERIKKSKPNEERNEASTKMLQEDVRKYNFLPDETLSDIKRVKADIFRFPSIVIYDLKIIHQMQSTNVWEVIQELRSCKKISPSVASSLEFIMSAAQYVRLTTYSKYKAQDDRISVLRAVKPTQDLVHFPQGLFMLMCLDLIPLKKMLGLNGASLEGFMMKVHKNQNLAAAYTSFYINDFVICLKYFDIEYKDVRKEATPEDLWMYIQSLKEAGMLKMALNFVQDNKLMAMLPLEQSVPLKAKVLQLMGMYRDSLEAYKVLESTGNWEISVAIGDTYSKLGDNDKASKYYLSVLNNSQALQHLVSKNTLPILNSKSNLQYRKYMQEQELEINLQRFGNSACHPDVAILYNNIGATCARLGDYCQALSYHEKSLKIWKQMYGDTNHPAIARSYDNIGAAHSNLKGYKEAISYYEKSLNIMMDVYGDKNHPEIACSYNNIGSSYRFFGDNVMALDYYGKSLEIRKNVYGGTDHNDIASSYYNMGKAYKNLEDYNNAISYYERSVEIMMLVFGGTNHPDIADSYNNIGTAYIESGEYIQAITSLKKSLEIMKPLYGDRNHPDIADSYHNIGIACYHMRDYHQAINYYKKSLEIRKLLYGDTNHPDVADSYNGIKLAYYALGWLQSS